MTQTLRIREVIRSQAEPVNKTEILWLHYDEAQGAYLLSYWENGKWNDLAGSGGGGGGSSTLSSPAYYGSTTYIVREAEQVQSLSSNDNMTIEMNASLPYVYIAIPNTYILSRVITANNENITSNFELINNALPLSIKGKEVNYKLYEFHLNSGLALEERITIYIS